MMNVAVFIVVVTSLVGCLRAQDACPPTAKMDMIIAMEMTTSIGESNFNITKQFARGIIQSFTVSSSSANFGAFGFHGFINYQQQIIPKDFPDNKTGLLAKFDEVMTYPDYERGPGLPIRFSPQIVTGTAIRHATRYSLLASSGHRQGFKDILLLFTATDSAGDPKGQADILRQVGGEIIVVGINPTTGALDRTKLLAMSGSESNLFQLDSYTALNDELSQNITSRICEIVKNQNTRPIQPGGIPRP